MPVSHFHDLCALFHQHDDPAAVDVFERMRSAPKFVFSLDVVDFIEAHFAEYKGAFSAAIKAGRTELPCDPMLVERVGRNPDTGEASLLNFWLVEGDGERRYRLSFAGFGESGGLPLVIGGYQSIEVNEVADWRAGKFVALNERWTQTTTPNDLQLEVKLELELMAYMALCYAMSLHVRGIITMPSRPAAPKLDRARLKRGLPPVTRDYVTVHIGYVTDRDGNRHAYTEGQGNHVRVHLRRGHTRNQACGPGRRDHKEIWIHPILVNYRPGVTMANVDYLVVP